MVKVRWLDTNGNINTRKFVVAGRASGASTGSTWQIPHSVKEVADGYDRGKDQWAELQANDTITIGDDGIPVTHYSWLRTLSCSPCVEAYLDGAWTRVNLGDANMECDPRKPVFSATITLVLPTDDVQQF